MSQFRKINGGGAKPPDMGFTFNLIDLPTIFSPEMGALMIAEGQILFETKHGLGGPDYVASEYDVKLLEWYYEGKPGEPMPQPSTPQTDR